MDKATIIISISTGVLGSSLLVEVIKAVAGKRKNDVAVEGTAAQTYYQLLENVKKELIEKMSRMQQDHQEEIKRFQLVIEEKDRQIKSLQDRVATLEKNTT